MIPILTLPDTTSTNDEVRALAFDDPDQLPVWIRAERQSAGRGRLGRRWVSPPGNLYASVGFWLDGPARAEGATTAGLPFLAGLAALDVVDALLGRPDGRLKWPNDVLVGGAKVSGVLIETHPSMDGPRVAIVGIGINLVAAPAVADRATAALADLVPAHPDRLAPAAAMGLLAGAFEIRLAQWRGEGDGAILAAWRARAWLGAPVRWGDVEGVAETVDASGALVLRLSDGSTRRVTAGDVVSVGFDDKAA